MSGVSAVLGSRAPRRHDPHTDPKPRGSGRRALSFSLPPALHICTAMQGIWGLREASCCRKLNKDHVLHVCNIHVQTDVRRVPWDPVSLERRAAQPCSLLHVLLSWRLCSALNTRPQLFYCLSTNDEKTTPSLASTLIAASFQASILRHSYTTLASGRRYT